jgi:hypothetical protein
MRARTLSFALMGSCLALGGVGVCVTACVDPAESMQEYLDRTQDLRNEYEAGASDASTATDAGSFSGRYFVACLSPLIPDPAKTLRFAATTTFNATSTGSGPITMQLQPLLKGATTLAQSEGPIFPTPAAAGTVTSGKFEIVFGDSPTLPKTTNPLNDQDWGINDLVFKGTLTAPPEQFCASLTGTTRPSGLDAKNTVCLFQLTTSDNEVKAIPEKEAYTCPQ